jgi:hypothetical protein
MVAKPNDHEYKMEVKGDGFMFELRDGAYLLIKMQSATTAMVTMWQGSEFIAPDTGNFFAITFRQRLADSAKSRFGEGAPRIAEDIEHVANILGAPQRSGKTLLEEVQEAQERSTMERLIIYARAGATFFHNSEKEGFASIHREGHRENYEISSPRFKLWVRHEFWRREKERLEAAALEIEGALHEGPVKTEMPAVVRDRDLRGSRGGGAHQDRRARRQHLRRHGGRRVARHPDHRRGLEDRRGGQDPRALHPAKGSLGPARARPSRRGLP